MASRKRTLHACYGLVLIALLSCSPLQGREEYWVVRHPRGPKLGFFYLLNYCFSIVLLAEKSEECVGFEVDFGRQGLYYSPTRGKNFLTYYFEPIQVGDRNRGRRKYFYSEGSDDWYVIERSDRAFMKEKIDRYLVLKSEILALLEAEKDRLFGPDYTIGVHYRGTDKVTEAPRVPYERVKEAVDAHAATLQGPFRIFVATDEAPFLEYMKIWYGEKIVSLEGVERSQGVESIHDHTSDPYLSGEKALLDCLLLASTDYLIRTSSNLSKWSTFFNPELPVEELNVRYQGF